MKARLFNPLKNKKLNFYISQSYAPQNVVPVPSAGECAPRSWNEEDDNRKRPEYPKPDLEQMLPYKPRLLPRK